MKATATILVFFGMIFGLNAQNSINGALVVSNVKPMTLAVKIDTEATGNWMMLPLADFSNANHIDKTATISGISISMAQVAGTATIYDDIVRVVIPKSMSFDDAGSDKSGLEDVVSENRANAMPWSSGRKNVVYGSESDSWGLSNITVNDIKKYGLYLEFKADGEANLSIDDVNVTIYFSDGSSKKISRGTFR
jgi:hypothetical protein